MPNCKNSRSVREVKHKTIIKESYLPNHFIHDPNSRPLQLFTLKHKDMHRVEGLSAPVLIVHHDGLKRYNNVRHETICYRPYSSTYFNSPPISVANKRKEHTRITIP